MGKCVRSAGLLLFLCLWLLPGLALAGRITVTGMGRTAAEAENDALRCAVEQAVGVLVDSQTRVRNNVLLEDEILTKSHGFITSYTVRDRREQTGTWQVTIDAEVDTAPNSRLMNELTRLGIIDTRLRNPRIAVYIPEYHIQYRVPDPAGETAVVQALLQAGFTRVIAAKPEGLAPRGAAWTARPYQAMTVEDMRLAARFWEADILIIGEGFSEGVGDVGNYLPGRQRTGLQSCRARLEAKMYLARTGQIIAADGKHGAGMDISQAIAGKKALTAAGREMGEYLAGELLTLGAGNRQNLELVVLARDFSQISQLQDTLPRIQGMGSVHLASYENGRGVFSLQYPGAPQTLLRELQELYPGSLSLDAMDYNTMTVRAD